VEGVFKNGQYEEAVRQCASAKELDPSLLNARRDVLRLDPNTLSAIDGLASILYQRAGQPLDVALFEESKVYHQKHIELKPEDPQPSYSIGVIDWHSPIVGIANFARNSINLLVVRD